jgi:hypothetical protein
MKQTQLILLSASLLFVGAFAVQAQPLPEANASFSSSEFGPTKGDWEFTLGGGGGSNTDYDDSYGGINVSVGYFVAEALEVSVRQATNYSNGSGDRQVNGSTFVALDQHFGADRLRPFVGVNFGGLYGDNTNETWAAGLEAGLKFYVQPRTFVFALINYAWTFEDAKDVDDTFDNGGLLWTVGVGFNF